MRRARILPLAVLAAACSTLAPKPPAVECSVDADCSDDGSLVCESGVCRDGSGVPPYAYIGLDLQELVGGQAQFRAEIAGCDDEVVDSDDNSIRVLSVPRREVAQRLRLATFAAAVEAGQSAPLLPSTFTLSQGSRFARDPLRRQVTYDLPEESEDPTIEVVWPRYALGDDLPSFLQDGGYLVWQVQPLAAEDATPQALRYQLLAPPVTLPEEVPCEEDLDCCQEEDPSACDAEDFRNACVTELGQCRNPFDDTVTYTYTYVDECNRPLSGQVVAVDTQLNTVGPVPGASVTIRHADPQRGDRLGLPALDTVAIAERDPQCEGDAECPDGLQCNAETEQCELPLAGLTAWTGTVSSEAEDGLVDARVFTYCIAGDGTNVDRDFTVTITPPEELGAPSVTLRTQVKFDPYFAGQKPPAEFSGDLCIPTLGAPRDISLSLSGEPRKLLEGYTCCDIDCLPRTAEDAESRPPEARAQCGGASSGSSATFRVETSLVLEPDVLDAWNGPDSSCVPIVADDDGTVGVLRRTGACGSLDEETGVVLPQCELNLPGGETPGEGRPYALRIETPVGSVAGSTDVTLIVDTQAGTTVETVALPDRVLVRGRVVVGGCSREDQTDGDCGSPGAQVLAERLRMEGESVANTPGPYYHQVRTFHDPTASAGERDGAFILPLDAGGVWVVTALPDSGTDGGPALFQILDLRDGTPEPLRLELEPGILVTVDVSSFDRRAQMIPLDTGSWVFDPDLLHPGRGGLLDLGAPGECLSTEPALGCRIRRLVGGSALPPSQLGQVRFTTRDLGRQAVDCR